VIALSVCRASNVWGHECKSRRLVLQLQSAEILRTVTSSFVWSWTISVNVNEGIQDPENCNSIHFICISIIHCLCPINSSTFGVGVIASVRGLHNSPFELKFELRPSWNDIHNTFPTGTAQDTTTCRNESVFCVCVCFGGQIRKSLTIEIFPYKIC